MRELKIDEIEDVNGGMISAETGWGGSLGMSGAFLGMALTVTAPVWGTALLLGGSILSSGAAIYYALR